MALTLQDVHTPAGLQALTCSLMPGQFTVVLGKNGAGKTSLCRAIAGFDPVTTGSITLDGIAITQQPPQRRAVAMVYQEFVNYPHWTVYENIASPLRARGAFSPDGDDKVRRIAEQLSLTPLLSRLPASLSGGQQQRVAIARALAKEARVLLLDEPLVNLDYRLREQLRAELRALATEHDTLLLYTSNDPREALALADQLILLHEGRILQSGPTLDVYREPHNALAADLTSDPGINVVDATLHDNGLVLGHGHARWTYSPPLAAAGAGYLLAVRPEHLHLRRAKANDLAIPSLVTFVETDGSNSYLHLEVGEASWVAHVTGLHRAAPGEPHLLHVRAEDVLLFPRSGSVKTAVLDAAHVARV